MTAEPRTGDRGDKKPGTLARRGVSQRSIDTLDVPQIACVLKGSLPLRTQANWGTYLAPRSV